MTSIALDPNIINLYHEIPITKFLLYLDDCFRTGRHSLKLACDRGIIRAEFERYYENLLHNEGVSLLPSPQLSYLKELLKYWTEWTEEKSARLPENIVMFIQEKEWDKPDNIEFVLIGLGTNNDVFVIVVGAEQAGGMCHARHVLHSDERVGTLRREFLKYQINFQVHIADRKSVV